MEVVTEAIGSDDEKHLELVAIPLVHPPIGDLHAVAFEFLPRPVDVAHFDGRAVLGSIAPIRRVMTPP